LIYNLEAIANNFHGPVNLKKQCGALNHRLSCQRPLYCHSHSTGAKKAVREKPELFEIHLLQQMKREEEGRECCATKGFKVLAKKQLEKSEESQVYFIIANYLRALLTDMAE